jgi:hypothetical protein
MFIIIVFVMVLVIHIDMEYDCIIIIIIFVYQQSRTLPVQGKAQRRLPAKTSDRGRVLHLLPPHTCVFCASSALCPPIPLSDLTGGPPPLSGSTLFCRCNFGAWNT